MSKIAVSVGHTPNDPGAQVSGLVEFNLASKIAAETIGVLKERGEDVYTVPFDLDLASTIDWINRGDFTTEKNDICIDIHVNDGGASGIEGWHRDRGRNKSFVLTDEIVKGMVTRTGLPNLGAKSEYDHPFKKLAFVHNTNCVSALIECGYMDNPTDVQLLTNSGGIRKFAEGIADGVQAFLKAVNNKPTAAQPVRSNTQVAPRAPAARFPSVPTAQRPAPSQYQGLQMDQNERRELIKRLYKEVLGREADPKGLAYYLYSKPTATEDEIRKEMTESTDHLKMMKNSKKTESLEKENLRMKEEISSLRLNVEAKTNELANMQKLLNMKTEEIRSLRESTVEKPYSTDPDPNQIANGEIPPVEPVMPEPQIQPEILDEGEEKKKGCFGWFRYLFGF